MRHNDLTSNRPSIRAVGLVGLLGGAMITATYLQGALSVLAGFVIDEFDITRAGLGVAFTAYSLLGAVVAPAMGSLTDKGNRRVMLGLFITGGAGLVVAALAPTFAVVVVGALIGGLALSAGNPVTNRIIAQSVSPARRGLVTGIKQSGPPLGLLAAGILLPPLAVAFGWRTALMASALIPLVGVVATLYLVPSDHQTPAHPTDAGNQAETRSVVRWLAVIGLAVALALSAVIAFLPLYAEERLSLSPTIAGSLAAFLGLTGVVGRIMWGNFAGRFPRPSTALMIMSGISLASVAAIAGAEVLGPIAAWIGTLGAGVSMMAWHAVAWLVIIERVGIAGLGKASGVMQLGNGIGFASGPPLAGAIIDATGSYQWSWALVGAVIIITLVLTTVVRVRTGPRSVRESAPG